MEEAGTSGPTLLRDLVQLGYSKLYELHQWRAPQDTALEELPCAMRSRLDGDLLRLREDHGR